ncbi:MAG: hypothetical protein ACT4OX_04630 [Actinomycetota bacterium]
MIPPWHPSQSHDLRRAYELWITCEDCGDVIVRAEHCELHVVRDNERYTLSYPCSSCGVRSSIAVTEQDVDDLLDAGFVVHTIHAAAELVEERPCAPPFTWDDLLAFHERLATWDGAVADAS